MSDAVSHTALVRRFVDEVLNGRDYVAADELFADDFVLHLPGMPPVEGREAFKQSLQGLHRAFPDLRFTILELFGDGDRVAGRWTIEGTHEGELWGIPATGRRARWTATDIFRIENGRIAENTPEEDILGLMRQLGVVPEPAHG